MDERCGPSDPAKDIVKRDEFFDDVLAGRLSLGQAVVAMRKLSKLTQPEFAMDRGLSVQCLRQIETENGNPTVTTLNKVCEKFGLEVGFIRR